MTRKLDQEIQNETPVSQSTKRNLRDFPWWTVAVGIIGVVFITMVITDTKYQETLSVLLFGRATVTALEGIALTIVIALTSFLIAISLGLIVGFARVSKNVVVYNIATFYVEVVRGIPLVVLMLYFAYVLLPVALNLITDLGDSLNFAWMASVHIRDIKPVWRAIAALAFGYGAYEAEVFRAGIQSIERGQMEAARSQGMSYFQAMRYVILPQAIRRVLPPLGNDFISMLKDSSLATVLAVPELTQLGRVLRSSTFRVFEVFNSVTILYLSMTLVLSLLVRALERRLSGERQTDSIR